MHRRVACVLRELGARATSSPDGSLLICWAGSARKRDFNAALSSGNALRIKHDFSIISFVSDQPDKRKGWATHTHCKQVESMSNFCSQLLQRHVNIDSW